MHMDASLCFCVAHIRDASLCLLTCKGVYFVPDVPQVENDSIGQA